MNVEGRAKKDRVWAKKEPSKRGCGQRMKTRAKNACDDLILSAIFFNHFNPLSINYFTVTFVMVADLDFSM